MNTPTYSLAAPITPTLESPKANAYPIIKKQIRVTTNINMFLAATNVLFFFLTYADSINVKPIVIKSMKVVLLIVQAVVKL